MRTSIAGLALLIAIAPALAMAQTPSVMVENAWARPTVPGATTGAIYLTVTDQGAPDHLVSAATPVAGLAALHETIHDGTVMKMRPVAGGLPIAADKPITLSPGGTHLMLTQLKQPLKSGQSFPLTLTFEKAGAVQTMVAVTMRGPTGQTGGQTGEHDMSNMSMPSPKP